jgi:hypothetical protein
LQRISRSGGGTKQKVGAKHGKSEPFLNSLGERFTTFEKFHDRTAVQKP